LILSSILFAVYINKSNGVTINKNNKIDINDLLILFSGVLLGMAIFTKIPAISMIPLVAFLILRTHRNKKVLLIWFCPVIMIPLIWPAYSIAAGQFQYWWDTISLQSSREGVPILKTLSILKDIDPVLSALTGGSLIFALLKRDRLILFWAFPSIIFLMIVGRNWAPYLLFIPLIPLFCIASGVLIFDILNRIKTKNLHRVLPWTAIAALGIFGLISTGMVITTNVTSGQLQIIKFVQRDFEFDNPRHARVMLVSNPIYTWLFKYVYDTSNLFVLDEVNDFDYEPVKADKILFISDVESRGISLDSERLRALYANTTQFFKVDGFADKFNTTSYPFTSMVENYESMEQTEVRICKSTCINYD
jgi:hypothetical protein